MPARWPIAFALLYGGCCVNPFVNTNTDLGPDAPGSPERETRGSLEEHTPAMQATERDVESGFDMWLLRCEPGVHLGTEQVCDVSAAGRPEPIALDGETALRYSAGATTRMSIQCAAPSGERWVDLVFDVTRAPHVALVQQGATIRVRIVSADGGFFDYPIAEFLEVISPASERGARVASERGSRPPASSAAHAQGCDLGQRGDSRAIGSIQECVVGQTPESDDFMIVETADLRRRSYPAGVQNRMTVLFAQAHGPQWADLVFSPAEACSALHIRRGDTIRVLVVSRSGGFSDYPIAHFVSRGGGSGARR